MKDVDKHMSSILKCAKKSGCVLILDFDGTLAPIVSHHRKASMSSRLRTVLRVLGERYPVAIVSGRSLEDIQKRVRIPGISYAGSHGLEFLMAPSRTPISVPIPHRTMHIFRLAKRKLANLAMRYPQIRPEDKGMSYALHYRRLAKAEGMEFVREANAKIAAYAHTHSIRIINDLSTFDIMPNSVSTKGQCALEMFRILREHSDTMPIYIGDSLTDEDAFRALADGITIRVGKSASSAARYYFKTRSRVDEFLRSLATEKI